MKHEHFISFAIKAETKNIEDICTKVVKWAIKQNLRKMLFSIETLIREGLNNAILHGCSQDCSQIVHLKLVKKKSFLFIIIKDNGPGFDWKNKLKQEINTHDCHGRGLKIFQLYADRVRYNSRGNSLILRLHINGGKSMSDFQINTEGNKATIVLNNSLTVALTGALHPLMAKTVENGATEIIFDLSMASIVDSSGIGLMIAAYNSVKKVNGKITVIGLSAEIEKLFKAMNLDRHFTIKLK